MTVKIQNRQNTSLNMRHDVRQGKKRLLRLFAFTLGCTILSYVTAPLTFAQSNGVPKSSPSTPVSTTQTFVTHTSHALSLFNDIKYPADFEHFDYVNPDAPKGGQMRLAINGSFDSLNPFIVKGAPAAGLTLLYDQLLVSALDEASTEYGLLAKSVEIPDDFSWVTYTLRENARWHDGTPITPEDVIFSLNILKEKGQPFFRFYYANIIEVKKVGPHAVKFIFSEAGNRELPLITGQLYILPKHYWETRDFEASTLESPLGSGPYKVAKFDTGRSITYERVKDYWGADLAVRKGQNNFDTLHYEYYLDDEVLLTALFADQYDVRAENSAKNWATRYNIPPVNDGLIKRLLIPTKQPSGMQGFFFNTRNPKFQDRRVREAIGLAFNFEWANKYLFFDQYTRTNSYFDNSELASTGLPLGEELKLLEPFRAQLPEQVFTQEYRAPKTDGSGKYRGNLVKALALLKEAGWDLQDGAMTHIETGAPLTIEFLLISPAFERVVQPFLRDLERMGISGAIRMADSSQYERRMEEYDFEVIVHNVGQSLSPGNEQREFWGSESADRPGGRNVAGIKDPVVDALIDKVIFAPNRAALITATRALDRVLLWGHYVVPQWYLGGARYAFWDRFGFPETPPPYAPGIPSLWWAKQPSETESQTPKTLRGGQDLEDTQKSNDAVNSDEGGK